MVQALEPPPTRPPWLHYGHLALTVGLLAVLASVVALAAGGRLHFGPPSSPPRKAPPEPIATEGRYRIEPVEDARRVLEMAGPGGFFGQEYQHVWVYRYQGGYLECRFELDADGGPVASPPFPSSWQGRIEGAAPAVPPEGYVLVAARRPPVPVELDLHSYLVHLGGLFTLGPAGPLHQLATVHLEARAPQIVRLFVGVTPPRDGNGSGFNAFRDELILVRFPFLGSAASESQRVGRGTDLPAGQDVLLLDWRRGLGGARLKGRFLPEEEVAKWRQAPSP